MRNKIFTISLFDSRYKRLVKKHPSLVLELHNLRNELLANPKMGINITLNIYKIRVANRDSQRGKSGGFRIITYVLEETDNAFEIILLTIYDKSEEISITKAELLKIIKQYL